MNPSLTNSLSFLKRYALIVIVSILVGNAIAWMNSEKSEEFSQYSIKVRSRVDYFDLVRSRFEKIISDSVLFRSHPNLKAMRIESFRNEDFYYTEMKLRFPDTAGAYNVVGEAYSLIRSDEELKEKYFNMLDYFEGLISEGKALVRNAAGKDSIISAREQLFELKFRIVELYRYKDNLEQTMQLLLPAQSEFTVVRTGNSIQTYATATILFFIIGLFIAVVADRFRN